MKDKVNVFCPNNIYSVYVNVESLTTYLFLNSGI